VSNLLAKGNNEKVEYYQTLNRWFSRQEAERGRAVNECLNRIRSMGNSWGTVLGGLSTGTAGSYEFLRQSEENIYRDLNYARAACENLPRAEDIPERLKLGEGSDLGVFYYVAGWLMKTESLRFALIVGLVGFGLLGSACSTFIRERVQKKGPDPVASEKLKDGVLVRDLTAVVIRGLSAAIVVFLAVVGGLAIFSAGNGQPNSYVLMLTCLVAAVYSETIWNYAEQTLIQNLKQRDGKGNDGDKKKEDCPEETKEKETKEEKEQ
jgi:hypothetical protein